MAKSFRPLPRPRIGHIAGTRNTTKPLVGKPRHTMKSHIQVACHEPGRPISGKGTGGQRNPAIEAYAGRVRREGAARDMVARAGGMVAEREEGDRGAQGVWA